MDLGGGERSSGTRGKRPLLLAVSTTVGEGGPIEAADDPPGAPVKVGALHDEMGRRGGG
jgi:hypothetical protein